jgi:hypothetical protein
MAAKELTSNSLPDLQDAVRRDSSSIPIEHWPGPTLLREDLFSTPHLWVDFDDPVVQFVVVQDLSELEVRLQKSPDPRFPFGRYPNSFRRHNSQHNTAVRLWSTEKPAAGQMVLKRRNIFSLNLPMCSYENKLCLEILARPVMGE